MLELATLFWDNMRFDRRYDHVAFVSSLSRRKFTTNEASLSIQAGKRHQLLPTLLSMMMMMMMKMVMMMVVDDGDGDDAGDDGGDVMQVMMVVVVAV
jgi:hypothetical protein